MTTPGRQYVRFLFLKLDPAWLRLSPGQRADQRRELGETILRHRARLMLRSYSLVGVRGNADCLLWQVADDLEAFQGLQTAIGSTALAGYLSIPYSFLGVTRRSIYEFPTDPSRPSRVQVRPQDSPYLFVYPFVKKREWYALPLDQRQPMMEEHVRIGRRYPGIALNTIYSFGLDDQDFVVAFEGDDPAAFVSLVMELRESAASAYTLRDTPAFTCIQTSVWDMLDALGGGGAGGDQGDRPAAPGDATGAGGGFVPVARLELLPEGGSLRVYRGPDAIALFRVAGRIHAVSDRCTHGRASLSEGAVDPATGVLTCPWHSGRFDLVTGEPRGGPVSAPLRTFEVRVDDGWILVK